MREAASGSVVGGVIVQSVARLRLEPIKFAARPLPSANGMICCFNDSNVNTVGAFVAGGGVNMVYATYGAIFDRWTVFSIA